MVEAVSFQPPNGPPAGWGPAPSPPPPQSFGHAPRGPAGPPSGGLLPHRGVVIFVLACSSAMALFIGCFACGPLGLVSLGLSIPAVVMARADMRQINAGTMDPAGRDLTLIGLIFGIVSSVLSVLVGVVMIAVMIFYGGLIGFALLSQGQSY